MKMIDLRVTRCVWDALLLEKPVSDHWQGFYIFFPAGTLDSQPQLEEQPPSPFVFLKRKEPK